MTTLKRIPGNARMSETVIHNGVAYLSGLLSSSPAGQDIREQTRNALAQADEVLKRAGSDKSRLLTAQIWLKDIANDFDGMNEEWMAWIDGNNLPTRATGEVLMSNPDFLVESIFTAAVD